MEMYENRRVLIAVVIGLALVLGAIGISGLGYQAGLNEGLMRGAQLAAPVYTVPHEDVPPAAAPAPQTYYAQPYYGKPWGWGGFNPLSFCFNIFLFIGAIWLISRLFFRRRFGPRRWHGGPWGHGWERWNREGDEKRKGARDGEVI
jgi:hypothetical protein